MQINDLKIEIITVINRLSDVTILKSIHRDIKARHFSISANSSPWRGADTDVREGVTFIQLMQEQAYQKMTFSEFTEASTTEPWEASLDALLKNAN